MLTAEYLELKRIFDAKVLWTLLPPKIPGRVIGKTLAGTGSIKPSIEICYPNGEPVKTFTCLSGLELFGVNDEVLFELDDAPVEMKKAENQPDLKIAYNPVKSKEDDLIEKGYYVQANLVKTLGKRLDDLINKVNRERREIKKNVEQLASGEVASRQKLLDEREEALKAREARLNHDIEAQLSQRISELNNREAGLLEREKDLARQKDEITSMVEEMVADERLALSDLEEKLKKQEQALNQQKLFQDEQQKRIETQQKQIARERRRLRQGAGDPAKAFPFASGLAEPPTVSACKTRPVPKKLFQQLEDAFTASHYSVPPALIKKFLVSTLTACFTGQFVVLSGPTGVGKTSMINTFSAALGAGCGIVPVRPAWIDPSDLLGFYNPQEKRYQPSPFLDRYLESAEYSKVNRLYFLALDEMNLSRVENYAADFLSRLEKARAGEEGVSISLYSAEIEQALRADALKSADVQDPDFQRRVSLLEHLSKYPASLRIPEGLILFGTINLDETTYHLSPKFLDRSFVLNIPHQQLSEDVAQIHTADLQTKRVFDFSLETLKSLSAEIADPAPLKEIWQDMIGWQRRYLSPLGIKPGFRFANMFSFYMRTARNLGLDQDYEVASSFFQTKLLPWISFHRDDPAVGISGKTKLDILQDWTEDESLEKYNGNYGFANDLRQINEKGRSSVMVQYLE